MFRFVVCELKTGRVLDEAPFTIDGELTRVLQGYGQGNLSLQTLDENCPANWEQLVLPWRSLIVVTDERDRILWHGVPTSRRRTDGPDVVFPCVTLEGYLLRRYVPTLSYRGMEQTLIARNLASLAADDAGLPFLFDCPESGVRRDREYADDENARIYNRLQELSAVQDGFDWTVDVAWADNNHDRVTYTFRTGHPYLGRRTDTPDHVFELPGNIKGFEFEERWGEGDAGTYVRAIGDGEGDAKVMSWPITDWDREAALWPRLEERRSYSSVTRQDTINQHAQAMSEQLFGGQEVITLEAVNAKDRFGRATGTQLGNISLGDTARVQIRHHNLVLDDVLVVVGWSLSANQGTYKPTLARI